MTPDDPNTETDLASDPLFRALSALPREDLDASRSERLRARAHAELSRTRTTLMRASSAVELLLMAACALLGLSRLAMAAALFLGH
jgi:hypothetical protein